MFEVAALFTRTGGGDPDMSSLLFLIAVGVVVCLICRPQPARDAAAAQSWAAFHHYTTGNGWTLLYVQNVYQHAQRGSKAMVSIYGDTTGTSRDAWFWWEQGATRLRRRREPQPGMGTTHQPRRRALHRKPSDRTERRLRHLRLKGTGESPTPLPPARHHQRHPLTPILTSFPNPVAATDAVGW